MPRRRPSHRLVLGAALTLILFAACLAAADRTENARWLRTLHEAHRGAAFRSALERTGGAGAARQDECGACHEPRGWVQNLILPMAPVRNESCGRCHQPRPEEPGAQDPALPGLGIRVLRPAHVDVDFGGPGRVAGLPPGGRGRRLDCAACHPDHEGQAAVPKVSVDGREQIRLTEACTACHLPTAPSRLATAVLKGFLRAHQGGNGFDPPLPEGPSNALQAVPEGAIMEVETQQAFVRGALEALRRQEFFGEPDEGRRGCTPTCHGEHTPAVNDADAKKYRELLATP